MVEKILTVIGLLLMVYVIAKIIEEASWYILKKDIIKEYIDKLYIEFEKNTMDEICNMIFEIKAELRDSYNELKDENNCLLADMIIKVLDNIDLSKTKIYELREKITCIRELFKLINWEVDDSWNKFIDIYKNLIKFYT